MLSISNFHSLHIELFLLLHSRAGFWEGCDLEYVSSPPGGWREGWKYSQDALPDGQSLRYYRVALCRLCVLAECPRLAHVFVIRKIRPRAALTPPACCLKAQMLAAHLGELFGRRLGPPTEPSLDSLQVPLVISCSWVVTAWFHGALGPVTWTQQCSGEGTRDSSPDVSDWCCVSKSLCQDPLDWNNWNNVMVSFTVVCSALVHWQLLVFGY